MSCRESINETGQVICLNEETLHECVDVLLSMGYAPKAGFSNALKKSDKFPVIIFTLEEYKLFSLKRPK